MKFELRDACFAYGADKPLFEHINLSLSQGEILTVLGPNGAGKTSLLRAALGFAPFQRGGSFLDGKPVGEFSARELFRRIAYVPQARRYSFAYTVEELVLLGRAVHVGLFSQPREHDKHIARNCLEKIGITNIAGKLCSRISGGELQMALIARALAAEPELMVLDEPEANLDFKNQYRILKTVQELKEQEGLAFFINTHFPEHALQLADRVLLLYPERCSESGHAAELLTEEKLQKLYSLPVQIAELQLGQKNHRTVIPFVL